MELINLCKLITLMLNCYILSAAGTLQVSLNDDPSLFPGHMEPLGAKQRKEQIETLMEYPSPQDFFEKYIKQGRPFLLKQGAKNQRAYKYWNDDYMKSFPEANTELVAVEPNLKEVREAEGFSVPLKEFLDRYHNEYIYMVNQVPTFLQKDVMMPSPLKCNNTRELMLDHVVWMSSGGTKSVLHNDDLDNINCLFRGSKDLLFINPNKYVGKVPIDKPHGGYSSLDVERVNFTKYPSLREVEYIQCHMEEGDCLFIPWKWYHQVNSVGNKDKQNIAVNIWFEHKPDHKPQYCELPEEKISLDNFQFKGMDSVYSSMEESEDTAYPLISLYDFTLSKTKYNRANLNTFYSILKKVPGIFVDTSIDNLTLSEEFKELALEMFNKLNLKKDKYISKDDFAQIFDDNQIAEELESWLRTQMYKMKHIIEVQLEEEGKMNPKESVESNDIPEVTDAKRNEL